MPADDEFEAWGDVFAEWDAPPEEEGIPAAGEEDEWDPEALADWFGLGQGEARGAL
jgi:hypothetical protein